MALHLLKLCVGADSIRDLEEWVALRQTQTRKCDEHVHTTRMVPKRQAELLAGGSLYWVIKGQIAARQRLIGLRPVTDAQGVGRCELVLAPAVIAVMPRPFRPFQGWRYLAGKEAPADIGARRGDIAAMPEAMRRELSELGLL
jgi:hypothetical protein